VKSGRFVTSGLGGGDMACPEEQVMQILNVELISVVISSDPVLTASVRKYSSAATMLAMRS
jgi:hypothetical protein